MANDTGFTSDPLADLRDSSGFKSYLTTLGKIDPALAAEVNDKAQQFMTETHQEFINRQADEEFDRLGFVGRMWDSFWVGLQVVIEPLFKQLGELDAVRQIETQKAYKEHRPTPNDIGVVLNHIHRFPDERDAAIENLELQGYNQERIRQIILAGRELLKEQDIAELFRRGNLTEEDNVNLLGKLGYHQDEAKQKSLTYNRLLDASSVRDLFLRDEIPEDEALSRMKQLGFNDADSAHLKTLFFFIPPVQDIIRMAVREVFTPAIAERFGQFDEYPEEVEKLGIQQGISPEMSRNYWAAHWELPPLTMGFEMLHRRVIDQDDLNLLLKAHDVMPFWRDKITAISFSPFTRVDIRRMYRLGVIDRNAVYEANLDIGYTPERAELLTQFIERDALASERDLSKTEIVNSYQALMINRADAIEMIKGLGYDDNESAIIINLADYKRDLKIRKQYINGIKKQFIKGLINYTTAHAELSKLSLRGEETEAHLEDWKASKSESVESISPAQLGKLVKHNLIKEPEYNKRMVEHGYFKDDISLLYKLAKKGG